MPGVALRTLAQCIDIAFLREAYRRTRKDGAVGVDRQTAEDYATALDRGRAIALLVPIRADGDILDDLEAAGRLSRSDGDLLAIEPVPLPRSAESPSKRLARLRRDER
jgi:hypothetical protein